MLTREELLLLLIYTAPTRYHGRPAIQGSTRIQKLLFLATRESELLGELVKDPYTFVPYDFGPYSNRIEQDIARLSRLGIIESPSGTAKPASVGEMSFEYLTGHLWRTLPPFENYYYLDPKGARVVKEVLQRLAKSGLDPNLVVKGFEELHGTFTAQKLEDLLRYVYAKYGEFASQTKRPDLLPEVVDPDEDEEEAEDDDAV